MKWYDRLVAAVVVVVVVAAAAVVDAAVGVGELVSQMMRDDVVPEVEYLDKDLGTRESEPLGTKMMSCC